MQAKGRVRTYLPTGECKTFEGEVSREGIIYRIILRDNRVVSVPVANSIFDMAPSAAEELREALRLRNRMSAEERELSAAIARNDDEGAKRIIADRIKSRGVEVMGGLRKQ
ncbi:hypothetical protein HY493_04920 [Candidatus Woesearchaeota archaeon]|nr:hypothetical protein [Candidatus Woesearchaeota archaeon]